MTKAVFVILAKFRIYVENYSGPQHVLFLAFQQQAMASITIFLSPKQVNLDRPL